jgi:hypothetical protein
MYQGRHHRKSDPLHQSESQDLLVFWTWVTVIPYPVSSGS